jgi:hypothetical protein
VDLGQDWLLVVLHISKRVTDWISVMVLIFLLDISLLILIAGLVSHDITLDTIVIVLVSTAIIWSIYALIHSVIVMRKLGKTVK